jgi:hypothetical protein
MTENKQQRPILIASFSTLFAAARISRTREMEGGNFRTFWPHTASRKASGYLPDCRVARATSPGARITNHQSLLTNHETPRPCLGYSHREFLNSHSAPVDITVDKGSSTSSEKPQQNQHFKYHRSVRYSYRAVNRPLTTLRKPQPAARRRAAPIVTLIWNMHRSGAACSLNVTSIGICLSRQHLRIYRNRANFLAEIARTVDSTGMQDYSDVDLWNARWPTSQGFFRGLHESA